ncbi:MAG: hypothetical protein B7Y45_13590 [Sphingomonas sp. 28-66-16]|nr:MAG: hypothetical protein B7Y45_13590 [Sphingomonas sp. 28-66-16]
MRAADVSDGAFLTDLYAGFRAPELAMVPWSPQQKRAFVEDQFRLQHLHFTRQFAGADFWVIERARPRAESRPIGRLYLDRSTALWRLIDIGLTGSARAHGLGRALIEWMQQGAVTAKASGIALHVACNNPMARMLYLRLGFDVDAPPSATHQSMLWRAPPLS